MNRTGTQIGLNNAGTVKGDAEIALNLKPSGIGSSTGSGANSEAPHIPVDPAGEPDGIADGILNVFFGTSGSDVLSGTNDSDHIFGMEGNDLLDGGEGDDLLAGEAGNDIMTGGQGNDVFLLNDSSGNDIITDFTPGADTIELFAVDVAFKDLTSEHTDDGLLISWGENSVLLQGITADPDESWFSFMPTFDASGEPLLPHIDVSIIEGTEGDDTLVGTEESDNIFGNAGDDELSGDAGNDVLVGGEGSDTLTGGSGSDVFIIDSKVGDDVITDFNPAEDKIDLMPTNITFDDLSADHTSNGLLVSWDGGSLLLKDVTEALDENWFYFLSDDPTDGAAGLPDPGEADGILPIFPGFEINVLEGSDENDLLSGGAAPDFIFGFGGNDELIGGTGDDLLVGGEGDDTLTGGAGRDSFQFGANSGADTVTDFNASEDILSFSQIGIEFSDLTSSSKDDGLLISWDGGSVFLVGFGGTPEEAWFNFPVEYPDDAVAIGF